MPKYVTFLFPYPIRNREAPYLWMMYKQLEQNSAKNFCFIGSKDYFLGPQHFATRSERNFSPKGWEKSTEIPYKYIIEKEIFNSLEERKITSNMTWKSLIEDVYAPLEEKLNNIFTEISGKQKINAIFTLCNCATLEKVAAQYKIPVIHVELGALRKPAYINTAYFDFSGCNGHTECETRYNRFIQEKNIENLIMKREDLLEFIIRNPKTKLLDSMKKYFRRKNFAIGIPQQIEDDSNILAYSNNFTNFELLAHCSKYFNDNDILVRKHPHGKADYKVKNIDKSISSKDFIHRCQKIATINSSVGLEALLYGKETWIYGDNPFSFIANHSYNFTMSNETNDIDYKLNFAVLGYLVPFDLLFNTEYIDFRLSLPSESEIMKYHYNFYTKDKNV